MTGLVLSQLLAARASHTSNTLNLDISTHRQRRHTNTRTSLIHTISHMKTIHPSSKRVYCCKTYRHRGIEEGSIHLIHSTKIAHASKENIALDNIIQAGSCRFQDSAEIGHDLPLYPMY